MDKISLVSTVILGQNIHSFKPNQITVVLKIMQNISKNVQNHTVFVKNVLAASFKF